MCFNQHKVHMHVIIIIIILLLLLWLYFTHFLVVGASTLSAAITISVSLSWSIPSGSVVDSYEVMWQRDTSGEFPDEDEGSTALTDGSTSYTIMGLAGVSSYSITVTAINADGSMVSDTVSVVTGGAGNV